jgi:ADP-ribose pyrophosphatase YjhB (NUDIX family)
MHCSAFTLFALVFATMALGRRTDEHQLRAGIDELSNDQPMQQASSEQSAASADSVASNQQFNEFSNDESAPQVDVESKANGVQTLAYAAEKKAEATASKPSKAKDPAWQNRFSPLADLVEDTAAVALPEIPLQLDIANPASGYTVRFSGWRYSNHLSEEMLSGPQGPIINDLSFNTKGLSPADKLAKWAEFASTAERWKNQLQTMNRKAQPEYNAKVVWFEDTGFNALARLVRESDSCLSAKAKPAETERNTFRCNVPGGWKLCSRAYDDPTPWCATSELKDVPSRDSPRGEEIYTWERFMATMNKDEKHPEAAIAIGSEGVLAKISHKSFSGAFQVLPLERPTLQTRLTHGENAMPISKKHGAWEPKTLPSTNLLRTGIAGKGQLGRWGPNFAADPVITRKQPGGSLEIALIQRGDCGMLALPGGMLEPGDSVVKTILKEFAEEALADVDPDQCVDYYTAEFQRLNSNANPLQICAFPLLMKECITEEKQPPSLYEGVVDDPRNTDNAWMETTAKWVHCNSCEVPESLKSKGFTTADQICALAQLDPATDADGASWHDFATVMSGDIYASHGHMLKKLAENVDQIPAR